MDRYGFYIRCTVGSATSLTWLARLMRSRSLAAEWEQTLNPATAIYKSPLDSIDLFVLLDLLGEVNPQVPSYFKTTHWAYEKMADAETRLRRLGLLKSSPNHPLKRSASEQARAEPKFLPEAGKTDRDRWLGGYIEDDHIPFQQKGVEILHMIAHPFPDAWHKSTDDGEHLDIDTVEDWAKLLSAFTAEWLDLDAFMGKESDVARDSGHGNEHVRDEL